MAGEIERVWVCRKKRNARIQELVDLAMDTGIDVEWVDQKALDRRAGGVVHQGVLAFPKEKAGSKFLDLGMWLKSVRLQTNPIVLALDQITDPQNLGACLRSAEAFGVEAVLLPKRRSADLQSPAAVKVACGALAALNIVYVANLTQALLRLKEAGIWVVGLSAHANAPLHETDLRRPVALVLGSEGKGLRRLVRESCDELAYIPMVGKVESLNVSVACGIALYEGRRQQLAA